MSLFKTKPGLPDHEKARVEFHLQQLAECIGFDLMQSDFLIPGESFPNDPRDLNSEELLKQLGEHLHHDVGPVTVINNPMPIQKCGGGG